MNKLPLLGALVVASFSFLAAPTTAAEPQADRDWQAYQTVIKEQLPKPAKEMSRLEIATWNEQLAQRRREFGLAFIEKHPDDPRRWEIVNGLSSASPRFVSGWGPLNEQGVPTKPVIDEAAAAAWKAKVEDLKAAMARATDLPANLRDQLALLEAARPFNAALAAQRNSGKFDLADLRAKLVDFAAKNPAASEGGPMLYYYMSLVDKAEPARVEEEWGSFTTSPNMAIAEMAARKVAAGPLLKRPLEIAFTAVDGRAVDLAKLRGKVVLIDFWATWCVPCMAEMPNVKRIYAACHDQGFEIIGISCDVAPERATGSWVTAARTGPQVLEFTQKEGMPWPEHYEGRKHNEGGNSLAARFAVIAIPANFLLDQNGNVVAMNLRGEALEREVKRLLTL